MGRGEETGISHLPAQCIVDLVFLNLFNKSFEGGIVHIKFSEAGALVGEAIERKVGKELGPLASPEQPCILPNSGLSLS